MASGLLVSICNVAASPRASCLLLLDPHTHRGEWLNVGIGEPLVSGAGICVDEHYVHHVSITEAGFRTVLTLLDRESLQVEGVYELPEVTDGHSVQRQGDDIFVASTGTDEVISYRLHGDKAVDPQVVWTPTGSKSDTHHINSLALSGGELLCSAFGAKEGNSWSTAQRGYIHNITTDTNTVDGLRQPHSVSIYDGELYFCNSVEGTVNTDDEVIAYLVGYSRGLAFGPGERMYAGTSLSRRLSRSATRTGEGDIFLNPTGEGEVAGQCAVIEMSTVPSHRMEISLEEHGREIYDLVLL
jgi:Domain of unknown function (DUF4915)